MNNSESYAKREFEILEKSNTNSIIVPFKNEIIALCKAFGDSSQSGGSASFTAIAILQALKQLMAFQVIAPLTGEDDEWTATTKYNSNELIYQNNRDSRVFKDGKNGRAYFIEAIIYESNYGLKFTSNQVKTNNGEYISCSQYIKSFPFFPETFYVDAIERTIGSKNEIVVNNNGDWWTHVIKNDKQLNNVFEYYDKKDI